MVLYALTTSWAVAGMIVITVSAHEFGHWASAQLFNLETGLPFIIPLGPLVIGATKIKGGNSDQHQFISIAGPIMGLMAAMFMMLIGSLLGIAIMTEVGGWLMLVEFLSGVFGSDGKKFRYHVSHADSPMVVL